ncbi:MAG: VOC family protein [Hyphomicrobiaceae bacterium]
MAGGLDHLVVVAHDLDEQAALYRRLGFQVGAQNRHDWGTLNHIVQFDGCFLELLTTENGFQRPPNGTPVSQFVDTIVDYLAKREGLAMMVLEGFDTDADHKAFRSADIGFPETFYFARQARRPDGEAVEVAFSLAFAKNVATRDAGFFVCQQHAPEMFWNPAFQVHDNGVTGIKRIVFACADPQQHAAFFDAYTGVSGVAVPAAGLRYTLARSAVDVMTPAACADAFGTDALPAPLDTPQFAAIEFAVDGIARGVATLIESDIAFERRGDRVIVPARAAMGVTIAFAES